MTHLEFEKLDKKTQQKIIKTKLSELTYKRRKPLLDLIELISIMLDIKENNDWNGYKFDYTISELRGKLNIRLEELNKTIFFTAEEVVKGEIKTLLTSKLNILDYGYATKHLIKDMLKILLSKTKENVVFFKTKQSTHIITEVTDLMRTASKILDEKEILC